MSIKLRLKYRCRSIRQFVESVTVPAWVWGGWIKGVIGILIIAAGVGYMLQINAIGTSGYSVNTLEKRIAAMNDEIQRLNSEAASAQSLSNIKERLEELDGDMVAVSQIQYARPLERTALAR